MEPRKQKVEIREWDFLYNIKVFGDSGVGKSSLISRFVDNFFTEAFVGSLGSDAKKRTLKSGNQLTKLLIWDADQQRSRPGYKPKELGYDGFIVVIDLTKKSSLDNAKKYFAEIEHYGNESTPVIVALTKADLVKDREIPDDAIKSLEESIKEMKINYKDRIETSAKNNVNIEKLFSKLAEDIKEIRDHYLDFDANTTYLSKDDEDKAKDIVLNIKKFISDNNFGANFFGGKTITLDNKVMKKVPDHVADHWDQIERARDKKQSFYEALNEISQISKDALNEFSPGRKEFTTIYYQKTANPEENFLEPNTSSNKPRI